MENLFSCRALWHSTKRCELTFICSCDSGIVGEITTRKSFGMGNQNPREEEIIAGYSQVPRLSVPVTAANAKGAQGSGTVC